MSETLQPAGNQEEPSTSEGRWSRGGWHSIRCWAWWVGEPEYANCVCDEQRYVGTLSDALIRLGHHSIARHLLPEQYDSESGLACVIPACLARLAPAPVSTDLAVIFGNHEALGCCDPKTLEHVWQSIATLSATTETTNGPQ